MKQNGFSKCLMWASFSMLFCGAAFEEKVIPATGDASKLVLPIVGGLMAISAIGLIVYFILNKKGKG